jgi:glycogen operon protein
MSQKDWANPKLHALAFLLGGDAIPNLDDQGKRLVGSTLLVLMNALTETVTYKLPDIRWGAHWEIIEDTADLSGQKRDKQPAGSSMEIAGRSLVVLRRPAMA